MVGSDEMERFADQILADRRISHSVYCGRCGYNLRMATYAGRCPECGNEYNARPTIMKGIFWPYDVQFPMSDILTASMCLLFGGWMIRGGVNPVNDWVLLGGGFLSAMGLFYLRGAYRKMKRYIQYRRVAKYIRQEEEE